MILLLRIISSTLDLVRLTGSRDTIQSDILASQSVKRSNRIQYYRLKLRVYIGTCDSVTWTASCFIALSVFCLLDYRRALLLLATLLSYFSIYRLFNERDV